MRVADGRIVECSREREPELFRATVGGMGLTGHILEVEFRLVRIPSPWIQVESERIRDIDALHRGAEGGGAALAATPWAGSTASRAAGHLGRGILTQGPLGRARRRRPAGRRAQAAAPARALRAARLRS